MTNPTDLKYSKEHEWVKVEGDIATVGISDYAQHALTDIVFVELPEVGKQVEQMKPFAVVESVKSVSDVFSPITGEVTEINNKLTDNPEIVNNDAFGEGWMAKIKITNPEQLNSLMSAEEYSKFTQGEH